MRTFRARLTLVTLFSCAAAMTLSCLPLAIWQYYDATHSMEIRSRELANVLGATAAAPVVFQDKKAIDETLMIASRLDQVKAISIRDRGGHLLGARVEQSFDLGRWPSEPSLRPVIAWKGVTVRVTTPIRVNDEVVGWLDMITEGESLGALAARATIIAAIVLVIAVMTAAALNHRLQPLLLKPIERLIGAMEAVTVSADFSIRAPTSTDPEFERALASFNKLVSKIGEREEDLAQTLDELKCARDAAESANLAKSQFMAAMSHELRTPLSAIIAYSDLLSDDLKSENQQQHFEDVKIINKSAHHLLVLINQVLDFGKIEAGELSLDIHEFDLTRLARDVVTTLLPIGAKNGNEIVLNAAGYIPMAMLDSTKIKQCLINLLANSCKFTTGGQISIDIRHDEACDLFVIAVSDTGIGMDDALIPRLFVAFTQADASTTRKYGGTGLGLAITGEFVTLMSGVIHVESTLGVGSRFVIVLPRRLPTSAIIPSHVLLRIAQQ